MTPLPIDSIKVPQNRQRTDLDGDHINELAASIEANGLLHPIVVREEDSEYILVAGECRLRAMKLLSFQGKSVRCGQVVFAPGHVPVNMLGELSPLEAWEAELEENIRRRDLAMPDRVRAIKSLLDLRMAQAEMSQAQVTQGQMHAAVGAEAFPDLRSAWAQTKVFEASVIAQHLDNPEVAAAGTEAKAMKVIRRLQDAEQSRRLALVIGKQSATELHEVHHANCTQWLAAASHERFDCILIDPPYGMDADSFGDAAGKLAGIGHRYDDTPESFRILMGTVAPQLTRVAKPEAHLYVWCDIDGFHFLRALFTELGWWVFRTPLINIKREGGRVPWPEHGPRRCYELALFAVRGKKPVTAIYRDVLESTLTEGNLGHGAQKPVEAYIDLLRRSCRPGDSVLDCFAGTGTVLVAAHQLKLRAVAVEQDAAAYGICLKRLGELK